MVGFGPSSHSHESRWAVTVTPAAASIAWVRTTGRRPAPPAAPPPGPAGPIRGGRPAVPSLAPWLSAREPESQCRVRPGARPPAAAAEPGPLRRPLNLSRCLNASRRAVQCRPSHGHGLILSLPKPPARPAGGGTAGKPPGDSKLKLGYCGRPVTLRAGNGAIAADGRYFVMPVTSPGAGPGAAVTGVCSTPAAATARTRGSPGPGQPPIVHAPQAIGTGSGRESGTSYRGAGLPQQLSSFSKRQAHIASRIGSGAGPAARGGPPARILHPQASRLLPRPSSSARVRPHILRRHGCGGIDGGDRTVLRLPESAPSPSGGPRRRVRSRDVKAAGWPPRRWRLGRGAGAVNTAALFNGSASSPPPPAQPPAHSCGGFAPGTESYGRMWGRPYSVSPPRSPSEFSRRISPEGRGERGRMAER